MSDIVLGYCVVSMLTEKIWVNWDDGHAGGYPHMCDKQSSHVASQLYASGNQLQDFRAAQAALDFHTTGIQVEGWTHHICELREVE